MIEFRDVDYSIDGRPILTGVSLYVNTGETRVILGPSGSGKSTTLRLLIGLVRPDRGQILIEGEDITRISEERLRQIRQRIGMVFQQGALFDSMTVGENVGYALLEQNIDEDEVDVRVREVLRRVIARALASRDPKILLYDEPTTGLDPQSAERITDLIVQLRDSLGKTSILVTHDIADAFKVGNVITVLNEGRVVFDGPAGDLDRIENPFIHQFLAPFRKAVAAAAQRLPVSVAPRIAPAPPPRGGTS
jgi:phospholipid/cholesterol/gamma-HCH transport system ATP-binding protein